MTFDGVSRRVVSRSTPASARSAEVGALARSNAAGHAGALASDGCHLFRNVREETTSCIITGMIAWLESIQRIKKAVSSDDLIFPGHDAEMITRFPNVAPGVSRLV